MPHIPLKRPRTEILIATAATVVSICAMVTTVYQTYILRQQQHAAVWPRLQLSNGYVVTDDTAFYNLSIRNDGVGPAIIQQVVIPYRDSLFTTTASLAKHIAGQSSFADRGRPYDNYRDLLPEMVIPQQESFELLSVSHRPYVLSWVKQKEAKLIHITVRYKLLYGET